MHAGQRTKLRPHLLRRPLLAPVGRCVVRRHRLQVEAMAGIARIGQPLVLELIEQKGHPLVPVAAMTEAGMGQEADHRLVDLHPPRRLRPVRRHRALRPLRRDRPRPVGDQEPDQDLQRHRLLRRRLLAGNRQETQVRHRPLPEPLRPRYPAERPRQMVLARYRRPDHHPVEPQVPGQRLRRQPGDPLAHQRPPADRRRNRREDRIPRQPTIQRLEIFQERRLAAPRLDRRQHRLGPRIVRFFRRRQEQRARLRVDRDMARVKPLVVPVPQP